ncbi:MAG: carboxypeptidase regulatory-like domain-containing protein, partial [Saprospiraceae bacterium]|nr:carboxypeptidase regulatory-like domain-containing protein [Saprospiraceae bacterium]
NKGADPVTRLRDWLDPGNLNPVSQNGYPQPVAATYNISGNIQTHWGAPMKNVKVKVTGGASATVRTDSLGNYVFTNMPVGGNYTITPERDSNDLNGVSTFDLVLISKHILGLEIFDSPWKIIAGDANKSNSLTTFDIVEIRKVILGINNAYPANTSWRFFPAYTSFSNPATPFSAPLPPESISISNLSGNYTGADFKGVKTGDANNSADPKY